MRELYAALYQPPQSDVPRISMTAIAEGFSPRYERHTDDLVSIDVSGLQRLLKVKEGLPARTIGEELHRDAASRGVRVHVAVAGTRMAALILALARSGVTIVERGEERAALAAIPIGILEKIYDTEPHIARPSTGSGRAGIQNAPQPSHATLMVSLSNHERAAASAVSVFKRWGLTTLGELASLPDADLVARLGPSARVWQAIARGEDSRPLVPTLAEERFDSSIELEWPIDGLEPLSFVLTRLIEPLSTRLERRDRGAAVLHVLLGLVTKDSHTRRLELPSPMRDVRTLRTLALLDLESHPPPAAIDRVTVVIDPTPGRVLQHALFTRAHPTPEQLSTLVARLGALMGQDRFGAPVVVESYRPGAFGMRPFATDHDVTRTARPSTGSGRAETVNTNSLMVSPSTPLILSLSKDESLRTGLSSHERSASSAGSVLRQAQDIPSQSRDAMNVVSALRRCRHPVPARVTVVEDRPVRVTTDRRGFAGGTVVHCAGPWRSSGEWWSSGSTSWDCDEWDVSLNDGGVYRIVRDRDRDVWFIDAIVD